LFIVRVHVGVSPVHAPVHPENSEAASGAAVSVTLAPTGTRSVHVAPHEIPAGWEVTTPVPGPLLDTLNR
jgi:hypothetical protein